MGGQLAREAETTLRLSHFYAAPPTTVFNAWTDPEALRRWWCPAGWFPGAMEIDLRKGGRYQLSMHDDAGSKIAVVGHFLTVRRPSALVYTWHWEGVFEDAPWMTVEVGFRAVPGGTRLDLLQGPLALPVCSRHLHGWMDAFGRIRELLDHVNRATDKPRISTDGHAAV